MTMIATAKERMMLIIFIFDAIIRAIEMKDQMAISIQHFEDLLCWGKDLYLKKQ